MLTTLDHISGGRAVLGMGAGWEELEQREHGIDPGRSLGERLDWLDEVLGLMRGLLVGDEVTSNGGHYRFDHVRHAHLCHSSDGCQCWWVHRARGKGLRIVARHADLWQLWVEPGSTLAFEHLDDLVEGRAGRRNISLYNITRLARALELPLPELFGATEAQLRLRAVGRTHPSADHPDRSSRLR